MLFSSNLQDSSLNQEAGATCGELGESILPKYFWKLGEARSAKAG